MKDMQIIVFGDSIVRGSADWKHGGWVQLLKAHTERTTDFYTTVYNLGIGGDSSSDVLKRFEQELKPRSERSEKNIVMISVGANDSYYFEGNEKKTNVSENQYQKNLKKLIAIARKYTKSVFFIGLLPVDNARMQFVPWDKKKSYSFENSRRYNELAKEVCRKENVAFLDIFAVFSKANYKKLLADGVHPNSAGHKKIFELVLDFLKRNRVLQTKAE